MLVLLIFKCCNVFFTHLREISRKVTTFFAHMQFFFCIFVAKMIYGYIRKRLSMVSIQRFFWSKLGWTYRLRVVEILA